MFQAVRRQKLIPLKIRAHGQAIVPRRAVGIDIFQEMAVQAGGPLETDLPHRRRHTQVRQGKVIRMLFVAESKAVGLVNAGVDRHEQRKRHMPGP